MGLRIRMNRRIWESYRLTFSIICCIQQCIRIFFGQFCIGALVRPVYLIGKFHAKSQTPSGLDPVVLNVSLFLNALTSKLW